MDLKNIYKCKLFKCSLWSLVIYAGLKTVIAPPSHPLPKKKYIQKQNKTSNYKPTFFNRVLKRLKNEVFLSFFLYNDRYLHSPYKSSKKAV